MMQNDGLGLDNGSMIDYMHKGQITVIAKILGPQLYTFINISHQMEPFMQVDSDPWDAHIACRNENNGKYLQLSTTWSYFGYAILK